MEKSLQQIANSLQQTGAAAVETVEPTDQLNSGFKQLSLTLTEVQGQFEGMPLAADTAINGVALDVSGNLVPALQEAQVQTEDLGFQLSSLATYAIPVIGMIAGAVLMIATNWGKANAAAQSYGAQHTPGVGVVQNLHNQFMDAYVQGSFAAARSTVKAQEALLKNSEGYTSEVIRSKNPTGRGKPVALPGGGFTEGTSYTTKDWKPGTKLPEGYEIVSTKGPWVQGAGSKVTGQLAGEIHTELQNLMIAAAKFADMTAAQKKQWEAQQLAAWDVSQGIAPPGGMNGPGAPKVPTFKPSSTTGIPGGPGYKENPIEAAGLTFLQKMQTNLETGTIQSLQPQLKSTSGKERYTQELETVTAAIGPIKDGVLTATQTSLTNLRTDLVNTHKKELDLWNALEKNQQQIAYADWLTAADTQYKDQTAIIADMSTKLVQSITDSTAVSASLATKKADLYTDQATTAADILGERGLYGLNLIAQRMKVSLDQMTTSYQKREDAASVIVAQTAKHGDAAINAAKLTVDRLQKKTDIPIAKEQKFSDIMAAGGSTIQQAAAASGLKVGQAYQALLLDRANRGLTIAQDAANRANANAAKNLSAIQNAAKVAEAKQNALIAVELARANTEFAGSGVHIEITGIQPTDAAAVASSVSWAMRTKVPR